MYRTLPLIAVIASLTGCSAIAEIAYDNALDRQRQACEKVLDRAAYQDCINRAREAQRQADQLRKGS